MALTYRAAVVQHESVYPEGASPVDIMAANMAIYELHMKAAKENGVQVIVFPEFGLGPKNFIDRDQVMPYAETIPPVSNTSSIYPCLDDTAPPVLRNASCFARNYGILVSLNMYDLQPCSASLDPSCPKDGRYQYNTEVIFDEQGKLIAKYYKTHVFYINCFNEPQKPDLVYFTSSFNVTFGIFVCFDIMFHSPAVDLVHLGIHQFLYSVAMSALGGVSEDIFSAWSGVHNSTLIASNQGTSRSGLFVNGVDKTSQIVPIPLAPADSLRIADLTVHV